ncbi:formate dehydrogenase subunit gamma [Rhodovibrionaceae bacterium A322]
MRTATLIFPGLTVLFALVLTLGLLGTSPVAAQIQGQSVQGQQPDGREVSGPGPQAGNVPGNTMGVASQSEMWRAIRKGVTGKVSIPNEQAGVLVQAEGDIWREFRNRYLKPYGGWVIGGTLIILAIFFLLRGRIKIEAGPSEKTVERFSDIDRFAHWTMAVCFIILTVTGMNLLWGRYIIVPVFGKEVFGTLAMLGKYAHNYVAFPFMFAVLLMFIKWLRHNIPNKDDLVWVSQAGGLFTEGVHPPARKFNAGQKVVFWLVALGSVFLATSGLAMMFPVDWPFWGLTFKFLSSLGITGLPAEVTPLLEQQLNTVWHAAMALIMTAVVIGHIYIGSVGMEGAFDAMGSGQVDENWAREHHSIWLAEVQNKPLEDHKH